MSLAPSAPSAALPLLRLGLALTAAVAFALDAEPFHRYLRAVAITPELLQTEAPPGYLRVTAYTLLGFILLLIAAQRRLGARSLHIALGIGFLLVLVPNLLASFSAPHYGVDSVSYTRYATGLLLEGKHPYADFEAAEALQRYPVRDTAVTYTNDGRLMSVFNYPPGSFLILAPLYALGDIDPRWLYGLAFFCIAAMLLWRAPPSLRPLALGFLGFHQFFALWAVPSGVAEPLWMALLLVAWLLRDRPVLGGAVLGCALAVKQFAWFFYPYYLIIEYRERGLRAAMQAGAIGAGVFVLANLPFLVTDPAAWLEGITAPLTQPLPPIGIGIARWATLAFPDVPKMAYTLLVGGGIIAALGVFWRWGGRYPALTFVLPWLPLWFSWRCLSAYFYLMPLMVLFVFFEQWRKDDTAVAAQSTAPLLLPLSLLLASLVAFALHSTYQAYFLWELLVNRGMDLAQLRDLALLSMLLTTLGLSLIVTAAMVRERSPRALRFSLFGSGLLLALVTLAGIQSAQTYQVDAGLSPHYAAELLLRGENPYEAWNMEAAAARFKVPEALLVTAPSEDAFGYPAGSFLLPAPLVALGLPNLRLLYGLAQIALVVFALARAPQALKPITLAVATTIAGLSFLFAGEGYNDILLAWLLLGAWLLRDRPLLGSLALGLGLAFKQAAWPFLPFYLIVLHRRHGLTPALRGAALSLGLFLLLNAPWALTAPDAWARGLLAPASVATLPIPALLALTGFGLAIAVFCRWRSLWERAALALPWTPLWFTWASQFSLFHTLPLVFLTAAVSDNREEDV